MSSGKPMRAKRTLDRLVGRFPSFRETEVRTQLRRSRWVSMFWLTNPATRANALFDMERRGLVTVKVMQFPMYRVVIHKTPNAPHERPPTQKL